MNPHLMDIVKGIAIGDALGSKGEFMGRQEVIRVYSEARARGVNWTDDTDMSICMVKAGTDPEKIAASFVDWMLGCYPGPGQRTSESRSWRRLRSTIVT